MERKGLGRTRIRKGHHCWWCSCCVGKKYAALGGGKCIHCCACGKGNKNHLMKGGFYHCGWYQSIVVEFVVPQKIIVVLVCFDSYG